jgi:arsenite methyltransferase
VTKRAADYGFDAPLVPIIFAVVALAALVLGTSQVVNGGGWGWATVAVAVWFALQAGSFVYTTRVGKFACWDEILDEMRLRGDESCIDLGCGRGMVVVAAARRLPSGRLTGVDIWRTEDQSGNALPATQANLDVEGVADRVTLETADITALPYSDGGFDLVVSALVIHNINDKELRATAVREAYRVLRQGGRLAIADFQKVDEYESVLRGEGAVGVTRRGLGWRYWYGGPWVATSLLTASKG